MKFSYSLIKQLLPYIKSKKELIEKLDLFAFETQDLGDDVVDVSVQPNRFSDDASHWGLAREIAALYGKNFRIPEPKNPVSGKKSKLVEIFVKDKKLCPRYRAQYFDNVKVGESPEWIKKVLADCGLRPINNIVDIMNYAMLETGQPLHAFDYDKLGSKDPKKKIIVRSALDKEKIKTLDDKDYVLNEDVLVIADEEKPIAIAGIKGGKIAEIDKNTTRIIVEAANFDGVSIYRSSRSLNLKTDASLRFSHSINPELAVLGLNRAAELLKGIIEAKPGELVDVNFTKISKHVIKIDLERLNKFLGIKIDLKTTKNLLELLGFKTKVPAASVSRYPATQFLAEPPYLRQDIESFEDVSEEIAKLYGYNRIKALPPVINLIPSGFEDQIVLKDKIRKILSGFGFSEVQNYSFLDEKEISREFIKKEVIELQNPISNQFKYLRPSLIPYLVRNLESNFRFFNSFKMFEIGNLFWGKEGKFNEKTFLGLAIASKDKETFFELKGAVKELFRKIGLVDYFMAEVGKNDEWIFKFGKNYLSKEEILKIESGGKLLGYLARVRSDVLEGYGAIAEINLEELLELVEEEHEYRPLPKYPSVMRDISVLIGDLHKVGPIMQAIQEVNEKYIEDVDLIDEYKDSYTFRIVFQADDRTLTDSEVNKEMSKIEKLLQTRFKATIR